jgi:UDP-N-acetylglucosamine--N-acetylmuramyl-(pentapeptide) pyrophosphoryl-undecaprenol N-acetylglucosamine transferase
VGEFAQADLMLCRSGASTMAELAAAGKASLLVPFPQAADDHQRKNADVFVAAEAAQLIVESELTEDRLLSSLRGMLLDGDWLAAMGEQARGLGHPNAVEEIGEMVVEISK